MAPNPGFPPRLIAESLGVPDRLQKITFADMRDTGERGLLIYCSDYKCSHLITMSGWPDDMRLSDLEPRFICPRQTWCGRAAGFQME